MTTVLNGSGLGTPALKCPPDLRHVADRLGITPQGALKIINDMAYKGYIVRRSDGSDGRMKQLALTPRAIQALSAACEFHKQFEKQLAEELGASRVASARRLLKFVVSRQSSVSLEKLRPT